MIANPAIASPAAVPHPFTLNDLRAHSSIAEEPSSTSALTLSGLVLAAVLAIGAFMWLDPLRLFTPTEVTPAGAGIRPVSRTYAADGAARDHCTADACPCDEIR